VVDTSDRIELRSNSSDAHKRLVLELKPLTDRCRLVRHRVWQRHRTMEVALILGAGAADAGPATRLIQPTSAPTRSRKTPTPAGREIWLGDAK
jgi:hypothetical protein